VAGRGEAEQLELAAGGLLDERVPVGRVSPSAPPMIDTVWVPDRIGCRPVSSADRLGVHCASTLKFSNCRPSAASWSIFGVGAPRSTPPP
jgi:hypothetical protein